MTITEKIERYFLREQQEGRIKPGEKLPRYAELCSMFNASYASVQKAFKQLEQKGVIEVVHGVGSFLSGHSKLTVELYLEASTYPFQELQNILNEYSEENQLHLDIVLKNRTAETTHIENLTESRKAAIIQHDIWRDCYPGSLLDYSSFNDYDDIRSKLTDFDDSHRNVDLPIGSFCSQAAINPLFLKKIGFDCNLEFNNLNWWDAYIECCHKKQAVPVTKQWDFSQLWHINSAFNYGIPMIINQRQSDQDLLKQPFFNTPTGKKILNILSDHLSDIESSKNFWNGHAGLTLSAGSWISVQHQNKFDLNQDEFQIIPYTFNNRKICNCSRIYLRTFLHVSVNEDEKRRVWQLLKGILSKSMQKKLTAISGTISPLKDMSASDHPWVTREDYNAFFPEKDDIIIPSNLINKEIMAALTTLFEQYKWHQADINQICQNMDNKLRGNH